MALTKQLMMMMLVLFSFNFKLHRAITLNEEQLKCLQKIIDDFNKNPTDGKYDNVLSLPSEQSAILPKVFIWCPIQHYNIPLVCPIHKTPFFVNQLSQAQKAQIRMVYDVGGNIILVQVAYRCPKSVGDRTSHKYLSAAPEIMEVLPVHVAMRLPLFLHHKSGFSNDLMDYLIVQICQGKSMSEIEEGIASMHYRKYARRKALTSRSIAVKDFHENALYSFPTNDKLMHVFLWYSEQKRASFEAHMKGLRGSVLLCDCSFTLGKKLSFKSADEKRNAESSVDNMFIGLNEQGQVVEWRLGKFVNFEDRVEVLKALKERLERSDDNDVSMILDADCCLNRAKYGAIFPDVQVKMGIVHALRRVMNTLPKDHPDTQSFMCKFVQIFNADTVHNVRSEYTPSGYVIEANLNVFLRSLKGTLTDETFQVVEELRGHIRRGCLSGIPPGEGTEKIDPLHRFLHKSYLSHVTVVTPEMVMAVLACIFYTWNCKKSLAKVLKTGKGSRPLPISPIEEYEVNTGKRKENEDLKTALSKPLVIKTKGDESGSAPVLVITSEVINYMISRIMHIKEMISAFKAKFNDKMFDVATFPIMSTPRSQLCDYQALAAAPDDPESAKHADTLKTNLANFGLELDSVSGDGNCLFGSVILQINKLAWSCPDLLKHLQGVGIAGKSLHEDVAKLRELCVKELEDNIAAYKDWIGMTDEELKKELVLLKEDGFFACNIGDLCIKVCTNVLQSPVIVVTSLPNAPYHPFLPAKFTTAVPVYVAFNHTAPGHYDGTQEKLVNHELKCKCGSKKPLLVDKPVCTADEKSGCPCAKAGVTCQPFCRCASRRCKNQPKLDELSCSCGFATALNKKGFVGCSKKGTRSRCRCVKAGIPCTGRCTCGNCGNDKPCDDPVALDDGGESPTEESSECGSPKKKRRKRTSFALGSWDKSPRTKTETQPSSADAVWSEEEIVCIMVCREVLDGCKVEASVQNISQIYRYLAGWPTLQKLGLMINVKDDTQILSKLLALQSGVHAVDSILIPSS